MIPKHYIPNVLTSKDKKKQKNAINKSKKLYKKGIYYTRQKINSFKSKISPHILKAQKMYKIKSLKPNKLLATKSKCSLTGLNKIVKKGQGAYYSSGSRPSQTGHSWGIARLASSITGGNASKIDYHILETYCKSNSKALKIAQKPKNKQRGGKNKSKSTDKNKKGELIFNNYPLFKPNLTPREIIKLGSFGGTYFRDIYSSVVKSKLINQHKEFIKVGMFKNIDIDTHVTNNTCNPTINKYGVKAGTSLDAWESSGWIKPIDPYGWFQWYCRFYYGRRSEDDERQIQRWNKYAGEKSGRWRKRLIKMCKDKNKAYNDYSVSPVIRQGLQQWGYVINKSDLK